MTKKQILIEEAVIRTLVLEALEDYEYGKETTAYLAKVERATAALRQALEQPAPAQEPESAERNFALREAHRNHRADQYFKARSQIDFLENRRIFEAGFDRGWDAKQAPAKQPAKKPLMSAEDRTWWASEVRAIEAKLKEKNT